MTHWRMKKIWIRSCKIVGLPSWSLILKMLASPIASFLNFSMTKVDTDDDNYRPFKRSRADFRPPAAARSYDDTDGMQSSLGRSQQSHSRDDVPMTDRTTDDYGYKDEDDQGDFEMYRVQGTLREWVTRDEACRFIFKKFRDFILTYVNPKNAHGDIEHLKKIIIEMVANAKLENMDFAAGSLLPDDRRSAKADDILPDGHKVKKGDGVYYLAYAIRRVLELA
ncbi:DNA replication licensing factor mcm2 [Corchorus olitorius]|uniref:DNA replication licensing factor mcm2 n=1 Tax=Corchorus olitorius TaxID=93759 RepID=A0A1R3KEM4_9ROSI|nr:DNA replication licensing factor mcm2 [Corchorus olitorius]